MLVPRFWAEGRIQERKRKRQITVRRFGWSDISQEEAQVHADERTQEAFARVASGEKLNRRERKMPYNGVEGTPIREEIISHHGDAVVTRNGYGAHCLNTPDVLFADIDFVDTPRGFGFVTSSIVILMIALPAILVQHYPSPSWQLGLLAFIFIMLLALPLGLLVASGLYYVCKLSVGGEERWVQRRVRQSMRNCPDGHLRLYRTPVGVRVLAMHKTFDPNRSEVGQFFRAWGVDPVYRRMCLNQSCFRARVSPKPWRMGIGDHIRPRRRTWPVRPEWMPERTRWIEAYEQAAFAYASCRFIGELGSNTVHPAALAVQKLHDSLCQANSSLPIA